MRIRFRSIAARSPSVTSIFAASRPNSIRVFGCTLGSSAISRAVFSLSDLSTFRLQVLLRASQARASLPSCPRDSCTALFPRTDPTGLKVSAPTVPPSAARYSALVRNHFVNARSRIDFSRPPVGTHMVGCLPLLFSSEPVCPVLNVTSLLNVLVRLFTSRTLDVRVRM